jgi:hypothetical protein
MQGRRISAHEVPEPTVSNDKKRPLFSLEHMQQTYSVKTCQVNDRAALASKLYEMSQLSWGELKQAPRHGQGFEHIPQNSIKAPMPKVLTSDIRLMVFRFSGKKPMVGYRVEEVFYLLWLDHNFTLYDHT